MSKPFQKELASFVGKLLRDHFGKGPESVYVSTQGPFLTIYLKNFLSPMESVLFGQGQDVTIEKTRDMMMKALLPEMKAYIQHATGIAYNKFYYDWSLHNKSGIIVGYNRDQLDQLEEITYKGKEAFEKEIDSISHIVQRSPGAIHSYFINSRTLIVIREEILIRLEKELIRQGHDELLVLTKRRLEKEYFHNNNHFETILEAQITDIFVDWDFMHDNGLIIFILNPK
ncbi:uncharacterized protein YbcI [Pullulanibacillus pueri]|uniref:Na+-translocating membrane potential-generating system MpsC domain-containing protein n=1 Tax=Pullulanibacillus pueri TaxID=1437324 RepID=A0A8J2ZXX6_9BACL|nr:Na-translocating system protein MpsC family protein [Pullulanibacillus pueri]MBM7683235.1 uncharacterized protein YbcI [Pullulanibacillus pueri]GGH85493.1 hypothetical protein GCM10007096_31010 [Pullulanibacillus pueri]